MQTVGSQLPSPLQLHRVPASLFHTRVPWCLQWPLFFSPYVADAFVQRATAVVYLTLCVLGVVWRNSPWLWWVVSGLTADAGCRVVGGDRLAVLSTLAEMVTTFLPHSYPIAAAPRQFAWIAYAALNLTAVLVSGYVIDGDRNHVALATLLAVQAFLQLLEVFGVSLPGLLFERLLVPLGVIRDSYLHKAEATVAGQQLKAAAAKAKLTHCGPSHTVCVSNKAGEVVLEFDTLTVAARTRFDVIRNCSVGYCFPLLGVVGITDFFFYAAMFAGVSPWAWKVLAVVLGVLYLSFVLLQVLRFCLVPGTVVRELKHPHLRYAYVLMLGVPLLSIDFMLSVSVGYCKGVLWVCAPLVIVCVLVFLKDWIEQPMTFEALNASWLLSVIVLIVSAFELPQVYPELSELAWLWLGFGLFMWAIIVALIFVRLIFTAPLPDAQRPTLFLLISTAAIATAAILFQNPQAAEQLIGPYSTLGQFLHWMATFLALLCYWLLLNAYFCRSPFNMSYWAISFPSAALALIWLFYWQVGHCDAAAPPTQYSSEERCTDNDRSDVVQGIVILCGVNAALSNSILAVNTVLALLQKRLFLPMPTWSPAAVAQLQHSAFRTALYQVETFLRLAAEEESGTQALPLAPQYPLLWHRLSSPPLGMHASCSCSACVLQGPLSCAEMRVECQKTLLMLELAFSCYMRIKREVLWPTLRLWLPQVHIEHVEERKMSEEAMQRLHSILAQLSLPASQPTPAASLVQPMSELCRLLHLHFDYEETLLTPLVHHFTDLPSANRMMRDIWQMLDGDVKRLLIPWVVHTLPDHTQRMAFLDCFGWSTDDAHTIMGRWLSGTIDPFLYATLCVDYPRLNMMEASPYSKFW